MTDTARRACIVLACGASGSGKSLFIKAETARAPRLVVWDACDEYTREGCHRVTSLAALARVLLAAGTGPGRYAYVPADPRAEFARFCEIVWHWPRAALVVEELAAVSPPGKAPGPWHRLISQGRKRGFSLYAATQRPAESDKTIYGNATRVRVGRLARKTDRDTLTRELDLAPTALDALAPLDYLDKNMTTGRVKKGQIRP